jgi:hypothetical protein
MRALPPKITGVQAEIPKPLRMRSMTPRSGWISFLGTSGSVGRGLREGGRRIDQHGPNEIRRRQGTQL